VSGIQAGTLIWGVLTSAGITALLTASRLAYDVLRWAGAGYLIWIGLSMLWSTRRRAAPPPPETETATPGWRRGLLTNLLNPKMGAFYVALLPQFIPPGASAFGFGVLLTCVHIALGVAWSAVLVLLAHRLRTVLRRPTARRLLDRLTGTVITAFGVRLALTHT
jgi:threonine/homoserine/homoserine lactone efflux protein